MNLLLVEDEPNVVSVVTRGLTEEGFKVSVAPDGLIGKKMALENQFDLVILDIMLPHMSGIDFYQTLLNQQIKIPTIFFKFLLLIFLKIST